MSIKHYDNENEFDEEFEDEKTDVEGKIAKYKNVVKEWDEVKHIFLDKKKTKEYDKQKKKIEKSRSCHSCPLRGGAYNSV